MDLVEARADREQSAPADGVELGDEQLVKAGRRQRRRRAGAPLALHHVVHLCQEGAIVGAAPPPLTDPLLLPAKGNPQPGAAHEAGG
eukprot:2589798-Prymnesium_polylepis.3